MTEERIEGLVYSLNIEIGIQTEETGTTLSPLEYATNGSAQVITFLGMTVWDSENDERNMQDGDPEPLEGFVRNRVQEIVNTIAKIRVAAPHPEAVADESDVPFMTEEECRKCGQKRETVNGICKSCSVKME